jgi:hypothetical protein
MLSRKSDTRGAADVHLREQATPGRRYERIEARRFEEAEAMAVSSREARAQRDTRVVLAASFS